MKEYKEIANSLKINKTLKNLFLCENQIGGEGMLNLVEGLKINTGVKKNWSIIYKSSKQ